MPFVQGTHRRDETQPLAVTLCHATSRAHLLHRLADFHGSGTLHQGDKETRRNCPGFLRASVSPWWVWTYRRIARFRSSTVSSAPRVSFGKWYDSPSEGYWR